MKQYLQKYLTISLALLVLLTSTGISVYEHVCHFTGKVQLTSDIPETCCPNAPTASEGLVLKKASCCDTHVKVLQLKVVSSVSVEKVGTGPSYFWVLPTPVAFGFFDLLAPFFRLNSTFWLNFIAHSSSLPLFLQHSNLRL